MLQPAQHSEMALRTDLAPSVLSNVLPPHASPSPSRTRLPPPLPRQLLYPAPASQPSLPPPPARPPPSALPSPPPPFSPILWERWVGLNCHGQWNGAQNVQQDTEFTTVEDCKARCLYTEGCEGICVTTLAVPYEDATKKCGLRRDLWREHCSGDTHHDTYVLSVPSPPPSIPHMPIPRLTPSERAADLNRRFREAHPSADLQVAGLMMHQFDRLELGAHPGKLVISIAIVS